MSDAMDYLLKTRSEALLPYFKFLKEAGKHLDTKTRDLISVITKVAVQTEPGFRQYLVRALRNGATPNEIIDALLMAFPALGLAKIIWATDIILSMNIPEFHPDYLDAEPQWHELIACDDVALDDTVRIDSDGRYVFIFHGDAGFSVYDSRCPHQVTDIPHLALVDGELTCPTHNWGFDIKTGECIKKGKHPLKRYKSKVENGQIFAYW